MKPKNWRGGANLYRYAPNLCRYGANPCRYAPNPRRYEANPRRYEANPCRYEAEINPVLPKPGWITVLFRRISGGKSGDRNAFCERKEELCNRISEF